MKGVFFIDYTAHKMVIYRKNITYQEVSVMLKKLISLLLLFSLMLLPCAQAETKLYLADPTGYCSDAMIFYYQQDGEYALESTYYVNGDIAAQTVQPYLDYLMTIPTLQYVGKVEVPTEDYFEVHHCFESRQVPYAGFSYGDLFDSCCFDIYYTHGENYSTHYISFLMSTEFAFLPADQIAAMATPIPDHVVAVQDPLSYAPDRVVYYANQSNEYCQRFAYQITIGTGKEFADAYAESMKNNPNLVYTELSPSPSGWIYHCFAPAEGKTYDLFTTSADDWSTGSICLSICYHPESSYVTLRYSNDFIMTDTQLRLQ